MIFSLSNVLLVISYGMMAVTFTSTSSSFVFVVAKNMNDGLYFISNGVDSNNNDNNNRRKKKGYSTDYAAEYFEVYSPPIRSHYSQVFWAAMTPVSLPTDIIERFTNHTMAIVGYEVDQVRRVAVEGSTTEFQDIPVPITHAYNHHYIAAMHDSRQGRLAVKPVPEKLRGTVMTHGSHEVWQFEYFDTEAHQAKGTRKKILHGQIFSEGNGGEMRLSYHGYPEGYAQLIQSPDTFSIQPMQIDTWNRDAMDSPEFKPGPLPKASAVRQLNKSSLVPYSGLIECPCADTIEKKWWNTYKLLPANTKNNNNKCPKQRYIHKATECFAAGQFVMPGGYPSVRTHAMKQNQSWPLGCTIQQRATTGILDIVWNELPPSSTDSSWKVAPPKQASNVQQMVAFASGSINVTVTLTSRSSDNVEDDNTNSNGTALIALVGPADKWFGIGFDTDDMCRTPMDGDECTSGGPYAIIVYGDGNVEERTLDFHGKGKALTPFMNVRSNKVENGYRTVVVERFMEGPDEDYYSFDIKKPSMPIIMATGCNVTLAQHCGHDSVELNFLATDTPRTVCSDGIGATVGGKSFGEGEKRCAPFPASTLLEQQNPTCSVHTYQGGLFCCKHMQSLLDSDQEIPWKDHILEYHLKFRFYFEEYKPEVTVAIAESVEATSQKDSGVVQKVVVTPASHQDLQRFYWTTEYRAGEYDIVQCPPGTPSSQCVQVITAHWSVQQMLSNCDGEWCTGKGSDLADGIELIYAGPHCHAPSCLSMELYNADTGELLCRVEPRPGQSTDKVYDELGYLAIPPCLWGHEDGLMKPVFLPSDTTLVSIKRNNNTISHFGEMASWQMRGVVIMDGEDVKKKHVSALNNEFRNEEASGMLIGNKVGESKTAVRRGRFEV